MKSLHKLYNTWLVEQGLPEACALELLMSDLPTPDQRTWLNAFIDQWDSADDLTKWGTQ